VFFDKDNSYSNRTGQGKVNVGVIGVLVFRERQPTPRFDANPFPYWNKPMYPQVPRWNYNSSDPHSWATSRGVGGGTITASAASTSTPQEAGTGHGREQWFPINEAEFEKRDPRHPDAQMALYYDTSRGLERRGIVLKYRKDFAPDPFPEAPGYTKRA
jgi:hypothetical protein